MIDAPIKRKSDSIIERICAPDGQYAKTCYKVLKALNGLSLCEVTLETGRTHQIRVHFAYLGAALIGDTMYGKRDERISHQALHCCYCRFVHPVTNETVELEAKAPEDFLSLVK